MPFYRKLLKLRRGQPTYRIRLGARVYKYRKIAKQMRIKWLRKWRRLKYQRGRWWLSFARRWKLISRKGRRWYFYYKKRLRRLHRRPRTFQIRVKKRYRPAKCIGGKFVVKINRRWRRFTRRFSWFAKYKGRTVRVQRKGRLAFPIYRGKRLSGRRLRFPRRSRQGKCRTYRFTSAVGLLQFTFIPKDVQVLNSKIFGSKAFI